MNIQLSPFWRWQFALSINRGETRDVKLNKAKPKPMTNRKRDTDINFQFGTDDVARYVCLVTYLFFWNVFYPAGQWRFLIFKEICSLIRSIRYARAHTHVDARIKYAYVSIRIRRPNYISFSNFGYHWLSSYLYVCGCRARTPIVIQIRRARRDVWFICTRVEYRAAKEDTTNNIDGVW